MLRPLVLTCIFLMACNGGRLEKDFFFKHSLADRVERMRQYSLEDQYRIFRYGNDKIEPPDLALANPIAEKGASAIPFLTEQLKSSTDDLAVRDILLILRTMLRFNTYEVKQDAALMSVLEKRISTMKSADWQGFCREKLENIKNAPSPGQHSGDPRRQ
jgi:hypothetical protein